HSDTRGLGAQISSTCTRGTVGRARQRNIRIGWVLTDAGQDPTQLGGFLHRVSTGVHRLAVLLSASQGEIAVPGTSRCEAEAARIRRVADLLDDDRPRSIVVVDRANGALPHG